MSHNVAVANSEAPAPSEMDTALLDAVSTALNEHPARSRDAHPHLE